MRLDYLLVDRRISLTDLASRAGHHARERLDPEDQQGQGDRFSTLDALCRELKCQPADLLEWIDTPVETSGDEPANE